MLRRIREVRNNESGFTLIELLIVIVILGILAAIVVFAVSGFNKDGQQAACQSDFKSVEIADESFFAKNQAYATHISDLVPTLIKQWPQTDSNGNAVLHAPYTILIGTATTGPSAEKGTDASTATPDDSACSTLG